MALHEWHPLSSGELAKLPAKPGVYVLFQIEVAIHVDSSANLRRAVRAAKKKFPGATHFAVEAARGSGLAVEKRVEQLRAELRLVRKAGFDGSRRE